MRARSNGNAAGSESKIRFFSKAVLINQRADNSNAGEHFSIAIVFPAIAHGVISIAQLLTRDCRGTGRRQAGIRTEIL